MKLLKKRYQLLAASLLLISSTATFAAHPICSSAAADEDGDGWGWENNDSCIVQATTPASNASSAVPACSSPAEVQQWKLE